jgi:hypothetical protein
MSNFIKCVENLSEEIEDTIERAMRAMGDAEAHLEAARQRKAELTEALREVVRGGEPEVDRIWLKDAEGKRTDLYIVFSDAIEAEGEAEVQKAVESHLEGLEDAYIDEMERSRADYVAEDNDWE